MSEYDPNEKFIKLKTRLESVIRSGNCNRKQKGSSSPVVFAPALNFSNTLDDDDDDVIDRWSPHRHRKLLTMSTAECL